MATLSLKPQHQTSVIGQLLDLRASITYMEKEVEPFYTEMEKWEANEYKALAKGYRAKFDELKAFIIANKATFNLMLSDYNLCVSMFIYKHLLTA